MNTITIWWHNRLFAISINVSAQKEEKVQHACKISCISFSLQQRHDEEGVDRCAVIVHAWPLSTCYMQMCLSCGRASPKCVCNRVLNVRNGTAPPALPYFSTLGQVCLVTHTLCCCSATSQSRQRPREWCLHSGGIIWRSVCTVSQEDPPYTGCPCSNGNLKRSNISFFKGNISIKIDIILSDIILLMLWIYLIFILQIFQPHQLSFVAIITYSEL